MSTTRRLASASIAILLAASACGSTAATTNNTSAPTVPSAATSELIPTTAPVVTSEAPAPTTDPAATTTPAEPAPTTDVIDPGDNAQTCSAAGMDTTAAGTEILSQAARLTRDAILAAATSCDYAELERIGNGMVRYSFDGDQGGAAQYWETRDRSGEPYLRSLVELLRLEPTETTIGDTTQAYGWPAVSALPPQSLGESARQQLVDLGYGPAEIDEAMTTGVFYGYRTTIDEAGNWIDFIAGD